MIEVRLQIADLAKMDNEVIAGVHVCKKLREAGMPVIGVLHPRSVESGVLWIEDDPMFGERIYRWFERGETVEVPAC